MRSYGKHACHICRELITTNGMGRISHFRKHVREGLMVGLQGSTIYGHVFKSVQYVSIKEARKRMAADTVVIWTVVEGVLPAEETA